MRKWLLNMELIFFWTFLIVIFDVLGATGASLTGPSNAAATAGDRVVFNCSTGLKTRLRWSTKPFGRPGDPQILTRENRILPNFESQYFVESNSNSQLNLGIWNASGSHAGRFICLELTTSNTASAELTVFDPKPVCNVTDAPLAVECDAPYKGTLVPELELKLQTTTPSNGDGRLIRQLTLGSDALHSLNLSCVVNFSENSTKNAKLIPENENGVIGTVAGNKPVLVSATECRQLPSVASIVGVHHFEFLAIAITSIVTSSIA